MMAAMEIEDLDELDEHLASGESLRGARLQGLDLTGYGPALASHGDLTGLVVLGGVVPHGLADLLASRGAIVFPGIADAPVDPWRGLYLPEDLYAGLDEGYAATPDARAYAWSLDARFRSDAYATLVRAIHDDTVTDHLDEVLDARPVVGVMGGHALRRGTVEYAEAAHLGHRLADAGLVVATGGGPGAMEAANLGAFCARAEDLDGALARLGEAPGFAPDVTRWAGVAMAVRADLLGEAAVVPSRAAGSAARSVGIPTWFYGHEPPNVFCDVVAKYFSNALREDGLLARSTAGVVVLPGAAGTVQEVFQAVTPLFYAAPERPLPPLVLVGREHWTERLPVWPLVRALARDRDMEQAVHLVDATTDVIDRLPAALG